MAAGKLEVEKYAAHEQQQAVKKASKFSVVDGDSKRDWASRIVGALRARFHGFSFRASRWRRPLLAISRLKHERGKRTPGGFSGDVVGREAAAGGQGRMVATRHEFAGVTEC